MGSLWTILPQVLLHFIKYVAKFLTCNTETNRHENRLEVRNLQVAFFVWHAETKTYKILSCTAPICLIGVSQVSHFLITNQATYISIAAIKDIQWAIIVCGFQIINIVLHFHLNTVSIIIFTTFEFLISVLFG